MLSEYLWDFNDTTAALPHSHWEDMKIDHLPGLCPDD